MPILISKMVNILTFCGYTFWILLLFNLVLQSQFTVSPIFLKQHSGPDLNIQSDLFVLFVKVAFKMYDLDNDDMISRDELLAILHMMVGANIRYYYFMYYL